MTIEDPPTYDSPDVQRHLVVASGMLDLPWETRLSGLATYGSGLPFTIFGPSPPAWFEGRKDETFVLDLRFFHTAPQGEAASGVSGHRGFFYHFLDAETGHRFRQVELSSIDTTLLLGGVLFAQSYFDGDDAAEAEIRALAQDIYARVEWTWMRPRAPLVSMGWHPEAGRGIIEHDWDQYNEATHLYVLALGSPTHALPDNAWEAWTSRFERQWDARWGVEGDTPPGGFILPWPFAAPPGQARLDGRRLRARDNAFVMTRPGRLVVQFGRD